MSDKKSISEQLSDAKAQLYARELLTYLSYWKGHPEQRPLQTATATFKNFGESEYNRALKDAIAEIELVAFEGKLVGWAEECIKRIKKLDKEEQKDEHSEDPTPRSGAW